MTTQRLLRCVLVITGICVAAGAAGQSVDWPLHDLNLAKTRYAPLDQIQTGNVDRLQVAWTFDATTQKETLVRPTPLVVDGVMYVNAKDTVFALNAATGAKLWSAPAVPDSAAPDLRAEWSAGPQHKQRGPAYGDGRLYVTSTAGLIAALDARTGEPVTSFGKGGVLAVARYALDFKYPGQYPTSTTTYGLGFQVVHPPAYHRGTLYVGLANGDNNIRGGLLAAVDGTTGAVRWVFNTIPQGPEDEGWALADPTWRGGPRMGGGIWTTPAIDPALGLIYVLVANPSPAYDGSARHGANLFTNALVALRLDTGRLAWHFQAIHHDIWDYDIVNGPYLVEATRNGRPVPAVAIAGKTCYIYVLDRQTGTPLNPIVETPVPTSSDLPGEDVAPTQPIPYTVLGTPQQPFCATLPRITDPALAARARPMFTPLSTQEYLITAPGTSGGASWGASSFSPKTGLFYVVGTNGAQSSLIAKAPDTTQAPNARPFYASQGKMGPTGTNDTVALAAYDVGTGLQRWYVEFPATVKAGNVVTAGDVLFQGNLGGIFTAFDARSGRQLWAWKTPPAGVRILTDPMTYQVNGKQYVAVVASNSTVFVFTLP